MTQHKDRLVPIPRSDLAADGPSVAVSAFTAKIRSWLTVHGDTAALHRMVGTAFIIRIASAGIAFVSQPILARWTGSHEYGVYVYVWTWVLLAGGFCDLGFGTTVQRYVAQYAAPEQAGLLRGFLFGSRAAAVAFASAIGLAGLAAIALFADVLGPQWTTPLALSCVCLPPFALVLVQDGIARSYGYVNLALAPPYILRPFLITACTIALILIGRRANATLVMGCAAFATWVTAIWQAILLDRRLARRVPPAESVYDFSRWMRTAFPVLWVSGFYLLLTYTDILVLQHYRPPEDVAYYFAAAKSLALVAFINFSVVSATAHKFAEYHVAGDRERLDAVFAHTLKLTFWPSLAASVVILALGKPFLWLFGPSFVDVYPVMFILAFGLLARATVGPAERLLNMLGEQRVCAVVYAGAFAFNLAACFALIPRWGLYGAAIAFAASLTVESALLFIAAKRRLGLHVFIWRP